MSRYSKTELILGTFIIIFLIATIVIYEVC